MASRTNEQAMISEKVAPVLVARTLGPFDLVVIFVAIVLFINNAAGVQAAGPSIFLFWILAFATFLITGGFVTAQLGRMFPEEGSLYVWTHKVLGPFWGFFAGFVAWWPGPISLVFIGILVANFLQQFASFFTCNGQPCAILTENWQLGLVVLAVLWFSASMSYLRMRVTQNYVNVQFWAYVTVIFLIGLSGVIWLLKGNPSSTSFATGWNPFQGEKLALGLPANLTFFSFAILALLGIETPLNMGVEVTGGEKAIRTFLFWGSIIVMAAYLWATWGNMVVIQAGGANGTTGGAETVGLAIGKWAGALVSLVLAWVVLTVAVVYNYSFGRLLFVSGMEKRLPHQFGKVNRNKVPANAITLQTAISTILTVFIFFIVGRGSADPYKAFYVLYAGVTIVWCISTALLFLDIFFAKRAEPERFERERRISLGWLYICGAAGFVVNILAVMFIFVGSWYPTGFPILRVWNEWMLAFTAVSVISGITIYLISQSTRRGKTDVEFLSEGAATQEIAEDTSMA
ncbi:MAG: APC family permease [Actinobacteria bacterium]|nr:MAG: APC family permease [Actinomycetota bacterium]